jgi:hypothetical protein
LIGSKIPVFSYTWNGKRRQRAQGTYRLLAHIQRRT